MIEKKHYYSMALLSLCISMVIAGYFFLIQNVWEKAARVSAYKNDIVFGGEKKQYAEDLLRSFQMTQTDIDSLRNFFVKRAGEVEFIEFVEKTARDQGLEIKINSVSLDAPTSLATHGMEYLVLRVEVKGTWLSIWNFSKLLPTLPYSVDVNSLAFFRAEAEKDKPVMWTGVYSIRVLKQK